MKAAITGKPQYPPPAGEDALSYFAGWFEGVADARLARQVSRLPPEQRRVVEDLMRE